jgi:hypothetical protein
MSTIHFSSKSQLKRMIYQKEISMKLRISCLFLLTFLLTACDVNATVNTNMGKVVSTSAKIANFDLPSGYRPNFSASLEGYTLVSYGPGDSHSHLYLIQSEKDSDGEKLASMVGRIAPGSYDPQTRMTIIETRPMTVREKTVPMIISEGVTSEGEAFRQAMIAFQGNGGPALVLLSEPATRWNQENVNAFIASIN